MNQIISKIVFIVLFTISFTWSVKATVFYVDSAMVDNSGAGTTWATAKKDIQNAINAANYGDEVWVKAGTYIPTLYPPFDFPTPPTNLRNRTIHLKDGVALYGGFMGTETLRSQRDFLSNETIINGNAVNHVILSVHGSLLTIVDGFTITGASSQQTLYSITVEGESISNYRGGGFSCNNSDIQISNCLIRDNNASYGGGINLEYSSPKITSCYFYNNSALNTNLFGFGGGIYARLSSSPIITNCVFTENEAFYSGACEFSGGAGQIINCTFAKNNAWSAYGGLYFNNTPSFTVTNSISFGNTQASTAPGDDPNYDGFPSFPSVSYSFLNQNPIPNPLFIDINNPAGPDGIFRTPDDGLNLQRTSLCVEAGNPNITSPLTDIAQAPRMGRIDIGAYEVVNPCYRYVRYVDSSVVGGLNDGSSWANAFPNMDSIYATHLDCGTVTEVWVAKGTYKPTLDANYNIPTDPRDKTFRLFDNMKLYGGFDGTETNKNQRNIEANPTIFSGDIGVVNDSSDNCYHVLTAAQENVTLDGITVVGGNANGTGSVLVNTQDINRNQGGGINATVAALQINNSYFDKNVASEGGAMFLKKSVASANMNNFLYNQANDGAAIFSDSSQSTINNSTFNYNKAFQKGGAMHVQKGTGNFTDCTFFGNLSLHGGAMWIDQTQGVMNNCLLDSNHAINGAGVFFKSSNYGQMSKNIFYRNVADSIGGAVYCMDSSIAYFENNLIVANEAIIGGGVADNSNSPIRFRNCTMAKNIAFSDGGALAGNDSTDMINCIVYNNSGSGVQGVANVWGNPSVNYSIVQGISIYPGTGNLNSDPLFKNDLSIFGSDNLARTSDDGFGIQYTSPALNAGNPLSGTPTFDIISFNRVGVVDIGAYEFYPCSNYTSNIIYVDSAATGDNSGTSWANAHNDLQHALEIVNNCGGNYEIWVAKGTYYPTTSTNRNSRFNIPNGSKLFGGFNGTETQREQRDWTLNETILSGDIGTPGVNTDNSYHVVYHTGLDTNSRIDGFTIRDGYSNSTPGTTSSDLNIFANNKGAGVYAQTSVIRIENCLVKNNYVSYCGAGVFVVDFGNPDSNGAIIRNTIFANNTSGDKGGALGARQVRLKVQKCEIANNSATNEGGGFYFNLSRGEIDSTHIDNNTSQNYGGGGFGIFGYDFIIKNSLFENNSSDKGGALVNSLTTAELMNTTFKNNSATTFGGAVSSKDYSYATEVTYTKCNFINNSAGVFGGAIYDSSLNIYDYYQCVFDSNTALSGAALYKGDRIATSTPSTFRFYRNIFHKNLATGGVPLGGAVHIVNDSSYFGNCVFAKNQGHVTGGIIIESASWLKGIENCIFFDNQGINSGPSFIISMAKPYVNTIFYANSSNPFPNGPNNAQYCVGPGGLNGVGNLNVDPLFVDTSNLIGPDNIWGTADDGLRLRACSPLIDAGSNAWLTMRDTLDLLLNSRIQGDSVDIGAYEGGKLPAQILASANTTDTANFEMTDAQGWTHYCHCDTSNMNNSRWLLSLKKNGNNIGKVKDTNFVVSTTTTPLYGTNSATDLSTASYVTTDTFFAFNRYWNVVPTNQPTSAVAVRFPYSATDFSDLQSSQPNLSNHTDMVFFKMDGTNNPHSLSIPSSAYNEYVHSNLASSTTWKYTDFGSEIPNVHVAEYVVNSFSGGGGGFGNGTNNGPLPVHFLDFSVYKQATSNLVNWTTASEIHNSHFNVQRSKDAIHFENIGIVNSKAINGNSSNAIDYSFMDTNPQFGNNYYRLEQVDIDGKNMCSKIINIIWTQKGSISIFPNPTQNILNVVL
ncbi:MAG: choice-of-anchor Q domain-containing protein [Chitinophagaceae bacterium]